MPLVARGTAMRGPEGSGSVTPVPPNGPMPRRAPGTFARRVVPKEAFTTFDVAERLHVTPRHVANLLARYRVPFGLIRRLARLPDGRVVVRTVRVVTATSLEHLLLARMGFRR